MKYHQNTWMILSGRYFGSNCTRPQIVSQVFSGIHLSAVKHIKHYKLQNVYVCPSQQTLQGYTNFSTTGTGFSASTDDQLKDYAKIDEILHCK